MKTSSNPNLISRLTPRPLRSPRGLLSSQSKRLWGTVGLLVLMAIALNHIRFLELLQPLQDFVYTLEDQYYQHFNLGIQGIEPAAPSSLGLLLLAFGGGLTASLSPCILSMLPINLSYIGTRTITSRRDAVVKASAFVLGVVTVLSLLGLFSSLAGAVMVQYRGYVYMAVGLMILLMGLRLLAPGRLNNPPLPRLSTRQLPQFPASLGSYGVGLTFALVTTPCSGPLMIAILAAAGATGSQVWSVTVMACYALGYTVIIFLASLFTGLAKRTRQLLPHSECILQLGSLTLIMLGLYYLVDGLDWAIAMLRLT